MTSRERRGTRYLLRLMKKRGRVSMGDIADAAWRATGSHRSSDLALSPMLRRVERHGRIVSGFYGVLRTMTPAYSGRLSAVTAFTQGGV